MDVGVRVGEDAGGRLAAPSSSLPRDVTRRRVAITRADSRTPAALKWMGEEGWSVKGQGRTGRRKCVVAKSVDKKGKGKTKI